MFQDPREIWEQRYRRLTKLGTGTRYSLWLERWLPLLSEGGSTRVLDLGCGSGGDSAYLSRAGHRVVAVDFCAAALTLVSRVAPTVPCLHADMREGLPFAAQAFGVVVANLSLHYFPAAELDRILREVRRCLRDDGWFLARFNSTRDVNYGAEGRSSARPACFEVDGMLKCFFDRASLIELLGAGWRLVSLEEYAMDDYGPSKVVWEGVFHCDA